MNYRILFILPFFGLLIPFHAASQSKDGKDSLTTTTNICECVEKKIDLIKSMFALVDSAKTLPEVHEIPCSEAYKKLGQSLRTLENECPRNEQVLPEQHGCENDAAWEQLENDLDLFYRILQQEQENLYCGSQSGDDSLR